MLLLAANRPGNKRCEYFTFKSTAAYLDVKNQSFLIGDIPTHETAATVLKDMKGNCADACSEMAAPMAHLSNPR